MVLGGQGISWAIYHWIGALAVGEAYQRGFATVPHTKQLRLENDWVIDIGQMRASSSS
jgi:hypothetical protein